MSNKQNGSGNEYRCAIEKNQNGKYTVRVRAAFGRRSWVLPVYFLASTFDTAMKRLEEALQLLQRNEERLWFFGRERSDDPNFAEAAIDELRVDVGEGAKIRDAASAHLVEQMFDGAEILDPEGDRRMMK